MQFCPHVFMLRKNYLTKHMFINNHTSPPDIALYIQTISFTLIYLVFMCIRHFLPTSYSLYGSKKKLSVTPSYIKSVIKDNTIFFFAYAKENVRGVFRTQSINYDWAFLRKQIKVFSRYLFSQKNSIADVPLGCKYVSVRITSSLPFENCSRINTHWKPWSHTFNNLFCVFDIFLNIS